MTGIERSEHALSQHALARTLSALLREKFAIHRDHRTVIAIAGESGSGKSITATALAHALTADQLPTVVLHQDDYFLRSPRVNHEHRCADLTSVGPGEVNVQLLATHLAAFRTGISDVTAPCVDYATDAFRTRQLDFAPAAVLIVEGTYVLRLKDVDIGIFLEATHEDTAERRRRRNRDIDAPIIDQVLAIEHQLILPQARHAHILIDRDFVVRV